MRTNEFANPFPDAEAEDEMAERAQARFTKFHDTTVQSNDQRSDDASDPQRKELAFSSEKYPVMSSAVFAERFHAYTCAGAKQKRVIMDEIIRGNQRLVFSFALKRRNFGVPFDDLVQEGNLGMMRAVERFNESFGYQFSTYAQWWIRAMIDRHIHNQHAQRGHRIPIHFIGGLSKIRKAMRIFETLYGRKPNVYETFLAVKELEEKRRAKLEASGKSVRELDFPTVVKLCAFHEAFALSLDGQCAGDDDDRTRHEVVPSQGMMDAETALDVASLHQAYSSIIRLGLEGLTEPEQNILKLRNGLDDETQERTLQEIGKRYDRSRERMRQIEVRAIKKICGKFHLDEEQFWRLIEASETFEMLLESM
jgi:RNA polymerase sigma factor (sigma-70 family)